MAGFGNPAYSAAMGNAAGMMVIAAGAVGLANALGDAAAAAREARYNRAYNDALGSAADHAAEMEDVARAAIQMVAELEAEVASLRAACSQRQEVIDILKSRRN